MKQLLKQLGIPVLFFLLGVLVTFWLVTKEPKALSFVSGSIPYEAAKEYYNIHDNELFKSWRTKSKGAWFDTARQVEYINAIKLFMASRDSVITDAIKMKKEKLMDLLKGKYVWKVGVFFGGEEKKTSRKNGLNVMYIPILVNTKNPEDVINIFEAEGNSEKIPNYEFTYNDVFNWVYNPKWPHLKSGIIKLTDDDNFIFNEGNMFP